MEVQESEHVCACGGNCSCHDTESELGQINLTREEYVTRLENYLVQLKGEIELVEGELAELRQEA